MNQRGIRRTIREQRERIELLEDENASLKAELAAIKAEAEKPAPKKKTTK